MAIVYNNKEYRNLQQQVLKNAQDIEELKGRPLLEIEFVDELPETGEAGILYLVPVEDGEDPNNYEEYIWAEGEWELIGSTAVDISNMVTTDTDQEIEGTKTFTSDITLYAETGDSPAIVFQRGELADAYNDWSMLDRNGYLQFNQDGTAKFYMKGNSIVPGANSSMDLGEDGGYFKEAKVNKYTVAASGYDITKDGSNMKIQADGNPILFRGNIEPTIDGTYALGKSNVRWTTVNASSIANDYSALSIKGKSGVNFQCDNGSEVRPSTDAQLTLGSSSSRWKSLCLSHYVTWGNNVLIGKDGSNRFYVTGSDGVTKLKVGASETLLATKFSPDQSNTYDLGRTAMRWAAAYVNSIVDANDRVIATTSIVTKPDYANPDVWAYGTLSAGDGEANIDLSIVGMPSDGLYMFTYGNAQCFIALTSTMIQSASLYPMRCTCPVLKESGGVITGNTGNLKISRASDILTIKVASTVSGSATSTNGWGYQFIKVM